MKKKTIVANLERLEMMILNNESKINAQKIKIAELRLAAGTASEWEKQLLRDIDFTESLEAKSEIYECSKVWSSNNYVGKLYDTLVSHFNDAPPCEVNRIFAGSQTVRVIWPRHTLDITVTTFKGTFKEKNNPERGTLMNLKHESSWEAIKIVLMQDTKLKEDKQDFTNALNSKLNYYFNSSHKYYPVTIELIAENYVALTWPNKKKDVCLNVYTKDLTARLINQEGEASVFDLKDSRGWFWLRRSMKTTIIIEDKQDWCMVGSNREESPIYNHVKKSSANEFTEDLQNAIQKQFPNQKVKACVLAGNGVLVQWAQDLTSILIDLPEFSARHDGGVFNLRLACEWERLMKSLFKEGIKEELPKESIIYQCVKNSKRETFVEDLDGAIYKHFTSDPVSNGPTNITEYEGGVVKLVWAQLFPAPSLSIYMEDFRGILWIGSQQTGFDLTLESEWQRLVDLMVEIYHPNRKSICR